MNYAVAAVTGFEIAYTRMTIHKSKLINPCIILYTYVRYPADRQILHRCCQLGSHQLIF